MVDKLHISYVLAIRRNLGSLENMHKAVWATHFHVSSTDNNPSDGLRTKHAATWRAFKRNELNDGAFVYKESLPANVFEAVKQVYQHISKPKLLKESFIGELKTQTNHSAMLSGSVHQEICFWDQRRFRFPPQMPSLYLIMSSSPE